MSERTKDRGRKSGGGRLGLCLAALMICATIIDGKSLAHHVLGINDFYVRANMSDPNETEADVCKCGYWVYVEWWSTTNSGTFDIEIWEPGAPTGPSGNDFYPPSGTKIAEISHSTSGTYTDHNVFEVNDVTALSLGEHTIRAWVIETSTSPPNAWEYSENSCTVNVVDLVSVGETSTEVCVNSGVTFTANSSGGTAACIEWQKHYRADSGSGWGSWDPEGTGPTKVLNTGVAGQYQYQARNGDDASCAPWKQSSIVDVVKVESVTFSDDPVCAGGTSTASATITPSTRDITWSIQGDALGCSIDSDSGVITAGTTAGTITVWAADSNLSGCHAEGQIDVVKVDLAVSGLSEGDEEDPGLYINANWDDDDDDGWSPNDAPPGGSYTGDKSDSNIAGGDNDFRSFTLSISPSGVSGNVQLTFGSGVNVWETNTKLGAGGGSSGVSSGSSFAVGDLPKTLYIEGASGSTSFKDVELKAEHTSTNAEDVVKITVFEVSLTGLFGYGDQQSDNEKKHSMPTPPGSSDKNGKISWDDGNADGTTGDNDPNCQYFHNCMELQGTVKPAGVTTEVSFNFDREKWGKDWKKLGAGSWEPVADQTPWKPDDLSEGDEDKSPSGTNHIYHIDGPGIATKNRGPTWDYLAEIMDFRDWVTVEISGSWYQCSDYYKWHTKVYTQPKGVSNSMTRDWTKPQELGSGWVTVPDNP